MNCQDCNTPVTGRSERCRPCSKARVTLLIAESHRTRREIKAEVKAEAPVPCLPGKAHHYILTEGSNASGKCKRCGDVRAFTPGNVTGFNEFGWPQQRPAETIVGRRLA